MENLYKSRSDHPILGSIRETSGMSSSSVSEPDSYTLCAADLCPLCSFLSAEGSPALLAVLRPPFRRDLDANPAVSKDARVSILLRASPTDFLESCCRSRARWLGPDMDLKSRPQSSHDSDLSLASRHFGHCG